MLRPPLLVVALLALSACDSTTETVTLEVQRATIRTDGDTFTYYALYAPSDTSDDGRITLTTGRVVPAELADTSIRWDLAFRGTEILLNSGSSGPGAAVGTFVGTTFDQIDTLAVVGLAFRRDGESVCEGGSARAVCAQLGSPFSPFVGGEGGAISVDDSRVLVLRTGDARGYAKVRFLSYTPADPASPQAGGALEIEYLVNPFGPLLVAGEEVSL